MKEKKYLKLTDDQGNITEYEILYAFKWLFNDKNYIVYTDNTYEGDKLNVMAAIFDPHNQSVFEAIETEEEWEELEKRIKELNMGDKYEWS